MSKSAAGCVVNSVDPDQTPRSAASDLGLYCLLRHVCPSVRILRVNTVRIRLNSDYVSVDEHKVCSPD